MAQNGSLDHFTGGAGFAAMAAGLSKPRLLRWEREGVFWSEHADKRGGGQPSARLYSYNDMVRLCALRILSDEHRVPLSELRKADDKLKKNSERPWSEISLGVADKKVVFGPKDRPRNGAGKAALETLSLKKIAKETAGEITELRRRTKDQIGKTERRRGVMHSAEVFCGTRIPIECVRSFVEAGYSSTAIIRQYPGLMPEDIALAQKRFRRAA